MVSKYVEDVNIFLNVECSIGNPLSRFVINRLSKSGNGTSILEEALMSYCGMEKYSLLKRFKIAPLCVLLGLGSNAFGVDRNIIKDFFSEPAARRGLINVMQSIGKYGVNRPFKLAAPFLVVWNYTNACNLRCQHCYQRAAKPLPDELRLEEKFDVIDQLVKNDVVALAFSGGEPIISSDFFEVASYASQNNLFVSLATNGTLLTEKMIDLIVESGVKYIEISLDAATQSIHDNFRGVQGSWEKTVQGIKNATKRKELFVCVASSITKNNFEEVNALIDLTGKFGARRFIAFNFIPTGNANNIIDADLTPYMREELLETLYKRLKNSKLEVMTTAPQFARACMSKSRDTIAVAHFGTGETGDKTRILAEFIGGCGAGRLYCAIQPNGIVTPCVYIPVEIGNLRTRDNLLGNCGICEFKNVCGGCRARAYA